MASQTICTNEQIVAYLDGELDDSARGLFEQHLEACARCRSEFIAYRQFLCELDSAMGEDPKVSAPSDFARIVAAHAETDMRGVRSRVEYKRALQVVVVLALFAFALLSASAREMLVGGARAIVVNIFGLSSFILRAIYDTAASAAVIFRVLSRRFVIESGSFGLLVVCLCLAVLLLSCLVARYHRSRAI